MAEVSEREMKALKLNGEKESKIKSGVLTIQRVVGGWIYWRQVGTRDTSLGLAGVFVSENVSSPASIS